VTEADGKAALERGRAVVVLCPPAPERAGALWELLGPLPPGTGAGIGPSVVIVCADGWAATEWLAAAPAGTAVHAVTGLARSARLLQAGAVQILAGAAKDLAALLERSALKLGQVSALVVAWPEALVASEHATALDGLLGEARQARRVVLSWNPAGLADFLERHARRALVVGPLPVDSSGAPLPPVGRARYCVVPSWRRAVVVRDALDALEARSAFIWDGGAMVPDTPPDLVLCAALPTRDELVALARLAEPVLFPTAAQLPYVRSLATLIPLALPTGADRARDRIEELRERVERVLVAGVDAELALLDPLFARFDPAEVAAALLALSRDPSGGPRPGTATDATPVARVQLFVNIGKKDRTAPKDLVGALIREAGVAKGDIGRVEVRETFSLVEVAAEQAARAARGLTGTTIRGRRVLARLDRER
jgi:hypothetical protein